MRLNIKRNKSLSSASSRATQGRICCVTKKKLNNGRGSFIHKKIWCLWRDDEKQDFIYYCALALLTIFRDDETKIWSYIGVSFPQCSVRASFQLRLNSKLSKEITALTEIHSFLFVLRLLRCLLWCIVNVPPSCSHLISLNKHPSCLMWKTFPWMFSCLFFLSLSLND